MADEIEYDFDAIVVGGGMSGLIAAYELAKAEKSVLVMERGEYCGAKNMTGGRIYAHSLHKVFDEDELEDAPFQRKIAHEKLTLLNKDSAFTLDTTSPDFEKDGQESYSVLRAPFDQWLAEKCEDLGVMIMCGMPVEELLKDDKGYVNGIAVNTFDDDLREEMHAKVVLLCDGANSLLIKQAGATDRNAPAPSEMAVGAKEVIELPKEVIEDRFNLNEGEGAAWMFAGELTDGKPGGLALYTNEDSISICMVVPLAGLVQGNVPVYQQLENFKQRKEIAPLLKGGKTVEYSGHLVPEGGYDMMNRIKLVGNGYVVCGDAAGMCINSGYSVRGMDLAVTAGQLAGQAVANAIDANDFSEAGLSSYKTNLDNSYVAHDLKNFEKFPEFMEDDLDMLWDDTMSDMVIDIFKKLYIIDGSGEIPVKQKIMPLVKQIGIFKLLKLVRKGMKAL
jgi:electron transfer flavoprotein-quinone oxidoreductase